MAIFKPVHPDIARPQNIPAGTHTIQLKGSGVEVLGGCFKLQMYVSIYIHTAINCTVLSCGGEWKLWSWCWKW
jgi:hypothetical protein